MDIFLESIFGRVAEDVEYHTKNGYPFALCMEHPDALEVAVQTAEGRHQILRSDMLYSPPYPDLECPGYIVLKNESAAMDMLREVRACGFECVLAHKMEIVPAP